MAERANLSAILWIPDGRSGYHVTPQRESIMEAHCQIGDYLTLCAEALSVAPDTVLRRAGLSGEFLCKSIAHLPVQAHFSLWMALLTEANRPEAELFLALAAARGPIPPSVFAFSCADTLALGLVRLGMFKSLLGPVTLIVRQSPAGVKIIPDSADHSVPLPARLGLSELLYITECARRFSGNHIVPAEVILPADLPVPTEVVEYLGCTPNTGSDVSLVFSAGDSARPLISRSPALWHSVEQELAAQLAQVHPTGSLTDQVRSALRDSLAGGGVSSEAIARRLFMSKRSLQRRLAEEGTSFQILLAETRQQLARHYLQQPDLSLSEIAYLLGFGDSTSFFRAFKGWTGHTPSMVRSA